MQIRSTFQILCASCPGRYTTGMWWSWQGKKEQKKQDISAKYSVKGYLTIAFLSSWSPAGRSKGGKDGEKTAFKKHFLQLGLVGVWTRVCHAENAPAGVGQVGPKLILERSSPEGFPSWKKGSEQGEEGKRKRKRKNFTSWKLKVSGALPLLCF